MATSSCFREDSNARSSYVMLETNQTQGLQWLGLQEVSALKSQSPILVELLETMVPLFQVMLNNSALPTRSIGTSYYVLAPPNPDAIAASLEAGRTRGSLTVGVTAHRVSQQEVRAHIVLENRDSGRAHSMLDDQPVQFECEKLQQSRQSLRPGGNGEVKEKVCVGTAKSIAGWRVRVQREGVETTVSVLRRHEIYSKDRLHCVVILFVDGPVFIENWDETRKARIAIQGEVGAGGVSRQGHPMWYTPLPPIRSAFSKSRSPQNREQSPKEEVLQEPNASSPSEVDVEADLRRLRALTRESLCGDGRISSATYDQFLLELDTDLAMFVSSYVCVKGFERFIVARVNQMVETVVEHLLSVYTEEQRLSRSQNSSLVKGSREELTGEVGSDTTDAEVNEDLRELVIVTFHSVVTAKVAPFLWQHWQKLHEVEDYAFMHACGTLGRSLTVEQCFIDAGLSNLPVAAFAPENFDHSIAVAIRIKTPSGVLQVLRVMELVIHELVKALSPFIKDVTADVCIPFLVYVLAKAQPPALPSTIKYLYAFLLSAFETSSLCYCLTTFEAACTQLLHEYTEFVLNR